MLKSICTSNFDELHNQRPSYYNYFSFLKTDGRHIGILLPISILTFSSLLAWHYFASASKSVDARRSYDVISIFPNGGHNIGNVLLAAVLMTALV